MRILLLISFLLLIIPAWAKSNQATPAQKVKKAKTIKKAHKAKKEKKIAKLGKSNKPAKLKKQKRKTAKAKKDKAFKKPGVRKKVVHFSRRKPRAHQIAQYKVPTKNVTVIHEPGSLGLKDHVNVPARAESPFLRRKPRPRAQ